MLVWVSSNKSSNNPRKTLGGILEVTHKENREGIPGGISQESDRAFPGGTSNDSPKGTPEDPPE